MKDLLAGGLLTGMGLWIWWYAGSFPEMPEGHPGPALFPRLVAAGLGLSGLALLVQALYERRKPAPPAFAGAAPAAEVPPGAPAEAAAEAPAAPARPGMAGSLRLLFGFGLTLLFPLGQSRLGFIPAMALLMFGIAMTLGVRWIIAVPTALGGALLIYGLFTGLLGVPLG